MKSSIQILCSTVKRIIQQLKPQSSGLSFVILTGKTSQGKKTLLQQSQFQHVLCEGEVNTDIYYNQHGILIALSENWLQQSTTLLQQTLKQLNRCHHHVKISGILLCVDVHELTPTDPNELANNIKAHQALLHRFGTNLGYRVDVAMILTKLDALAGFCEFYQHEHESDLRKPLGFSLNDSQDKERLDKQLKLQFNQFIETLHQQVLNKVHPARSSIKRTLIREFPLQLASIQFGILLLVKSISPKLYRLQSLFFTSAEQGGVSHDQLHKKIQHEYALTIQDKHPLSNNYRAYFVEGALLSFQLQTKQYELSHPLLSFKKASVLASIALTTLVFLTYSHVKSNQLLDKASKEWLAFDAAATNGQEGVTAMHHLTTASSSLDKMTHSFMVPGSVKILKQQLDKNKTAYLQETFIPGILKDIETILTDNHQSHGVRYQALKVYLMLASPRDYQSKTITAWFKSQPANGLSKEDMDKKIALVHLASTMGLSTPRINQQLVADTRNYLNALPVGYLYYSIAKNSFPTEKQPIAIKGFTLADDSLPNYFTKTGYRAVIQQFPQIAKQLASESWVLNQPVPDHLNTVLMQAFSYDYALWWKQFIKKTTPLHARNYQEAIHLTQLLRQSNAFEQLINLIQDQTSPELGESAADFNQLISNQFTDINLLSQSAVTPLAHNLSDMEKFLTTLSIVNDQGKTAFTIAKSRFQGDNLNNPLSIMFNQADQVPEPVASWVKQVAGDTWFILISDAKQYMNAQWKHDVYEQYAKSIAKRYPFDQLGDGEVAIDDFNHFFAPQGTLNTFTEAYIKPFLDTSEPQWKPKEMNQFVMPISNDTINEMIRANVITNMFFKHPNDVSQIEFSLQKSDLDPAVSSLYLKIGDKRIHDTQDNNSFTQLQWPQSDVKLSITTLEGKTFSLDEHGVWAFFKLLQKVDVQPDAEDSSVLQVLFEINGNSGRYVLKTQNEINPFMPGILNGFNLSESIA